MLKLSISHRTANGDSMLPEKDVDQMDTLVTVIGPKQKNKPKQKTA